MFSAQINRKKCENRNFDKILTVKQEFCEYFHGETEEFWEHIFSDTDGFEFSAMWSFGLTMFYAPANYTYFLPSTKRPQFHVICKALAFAVFIF